MLLSEPGRLVWYPNSKSEGRDDEFHCSHDGEAAWRDATSATDDLVRPSNPVPAHSLNDGPGAVGSGRELNNNGRRPRPDSKVPISIRDAARAAGLAGVVPAARVPTTASKTLFYLVGTHFRDRHALAKR